MAEVIVVNDGSRDDTPEIVRSFARQHPAVRMVENPGNLPVPPPSPDGAAPFRPLPGAGTEERR